MGILFMGTWRSERLPANIFALMPIKNDLRQMTAAWHRLPVWSDSDHGHWLTVADLLAEPIAKRLADLLTPSHRRSTKMVCTSHSAKFFFTTVKR